MGLALEMAFRIRKIVVVSIRTCYRSVRNYPFLFGLLCFLILLYRSCPFLFSLLVSASPVLICTAVLLGTLLSYGQPNIPEIDTEEKVSHDVVSLRSGFLENPTVLAEENENFAVERFSGNEVESSIVEKGSTEIRKTGKFDEHEGLVESAPLIQNSDRDIQFEKGEVETPFEKEFHNSLLETRREINEENLDTKSLVIEGETAVDNQYFLVHSTRNDQMFEVENLEKPREPVHKGDLNLSPIDNDQNDYDSSESGSDGAESSSPDASMADIIPLLDELHPLLDSEVPQPINRSIVESDASSEQSHKSDGECVISDDDAENQGEGRDAVDNDDDEDDDDDDDEYEGMQEEKEDESKSAIKWTEDDEKNLMDLGTLELERNQRLENLIARRRARNNLRMLAGKNLIDLDGFELPVNVPPISTARRNPFDLPYDSTNDLGLPPIPGSAPSILLPRRNPFDLPYDPNEEKPDLKSDELEQEFLTSQQKETFFRRHESFSVCPSSFEVPKQEQQNIRWRPYFLPEKVASEGPSYSPLERQFSEVSETKLSSVSDTESLSSIADQDDKKPDESQSYLETASVAYLDHETSHIERGNGSWEDANSEDFVQVENRDVHHEVIEITLGSTDSHFESQSGLSEIGAVDASMVQNASEILSKNVVVETDYSSHSSLSSLSEVSEKPFEVNANEERPSSPHMEESGILLKPSLEDTEFKTSSEMLDDNHHKEPVYDSSPSAEGKDSEAHSDVGEDDTSAFKDMNAASLESCAMDRNELESREVAEVIKHEVTNVESSKVDTKFDALNVTVVSELGVEHVGPSADIGSIEKEIVDDNIKDDEDCQSSHKEEIFNGIHPNEDENLGSSPTNDHISSRSLTFSEPEDQLSSVVDHVSADTGSPHAGMHGRLDHEESPEFEPAIIYSSSSSNSSTIEEVILQKNENFHSDQVSVATPDHNLGNPTHDLHDKGLFAADVTFPAPQEQSSIVVGVQVTVTPSNTIFPSSEVEKVDECLMNEKEVRSEQDYAQSSSIRLHDLDIKIASSDSTYHNVTSEVTTSVTDLDPAYIDNTVVDPALNNFDDAREPCSIPTDFASEVVSENITPEVHRDISTGHSSVSSDSTSISSDNPNFKSSIVGRDPKDDIVDDAVRENRVELSEHLDQLAEAYGSHFSEMIVKEEVDEIEEIEEGLLSELDEVGDFSVKEKGIPPEEAQTERVESDILSKSSNLTEAKSELPVLEVRTIDDINLAFRQIHEGVDVDEVILPSSIEDQIQEEAKTKVESRELPILEVRTIDDINLAFKQLHEGVDVEEVILPSAVEDQVKEEAKEITNSDLEVVTARSLGDIHVALMQASENNKSGELPTNSSPENQSEKVEAVSSESAMEIVSSNTSNAEKPGDIIIDESVHPNENFSNTKD